jgi:hypothetical protein
VEKSIDRGPFKVVRKVGLTAHELDLPDSWKGGHVFNEGRLKRFNSPTFNTQESAPLRPELELVNDNSEEYEVREILAE